jgi:hypothetical protein
VYRRVLNFVHLNTLLQVLSVVGILQDEVDPMVFVMKVEKAPMILLWVRCSDSRNQVMLCQL